MIFPDVRLLVLAFWLGAALGAVFVLSELLRLVLSLSKYTVFLLDVLFCLFCAVLTFLLALVGTNGQLRLYWFVPEALGFYCAYIPLSPVLRRISFRMQRFSARKRRKRRILTASFHKRSEKNEKNT